METQELAREFTRAYPAGDIEALRALFQPDAVVRHNFEPRQQSLDENLALIDSIVAAGHELRYEDVRREFFASGFVQEHRVNGRTPDGKTWTAEACVVFHARDGRLVSLSEYMDPASLSPMMSENA